MLCGGWHVAMSTDPKPAKPKQTWSSWWLRWGRRLFVAGLISLLFAMGLTRWVAGEPNATGQVVSLSVPDDSAPRNELVIMSVNCAHGRGEGFHQALISTKTVRANCQAIGDLLSKSKADIACLSRVRCSILVERTIRACEGDCRVGRFISFRSGT